MKLFLNNATIIQVTWYIIETGKLSFIFQQTPDRSVRFVVCLVKCQAAIVSGLVCHESLRVVIKMRIIKMTIITAFNQATCRQSLSKWWPQMTNDDDDHCKRLKWLRHHHYHWLCDFIHLWMVIITGDAAAANAIATSQLQANDLGWIVNLSNVWRIVDTQGGE